ncbi:unnamed protein product [Clonostachys rosea f. rosea IK726]|uniref:Uncharacterized protein n=1 Tax=Clonostachys rosea f. rosea IK726 TaxID=1349383 RepID=A0ACA9T7D1_BIOOC|nr:unnamed protein product [Clonostachys rosea f. rosea IK726]
MGDIEKPELPIELEKGSSHVDKSGIEYERAQLLANLPDPDAGKTDEERKEIDKKLMRKVDLWLIPWLSLLYLLSFLDRTNIGNARLEGMELDLGMVEGNYNMALTIFFIGYAVAEPITNALLKRLTPRIFFTGIIVVWGIIMTLMGLCKNNAGLLAARWFLGIAEAGLFPGVNYYLSCWYKSSEIGVRSSLFFSAAALAGSFGGLLAAAIAKMKGGLATTLVGVFCWWMVFDWPETASFLNEDDRIRVQRRLIKDRQGRTAEDFDKRHIYAALKDWKTYGYMVQYAGTFLGAAGIYPTIPNTLSWLNNNTEGSLKRAFVLGMVVGWGNLNGVVSSNIYLTRESPHFWTGHGVVLGYQVVCLLGGTIFMHFALRKMNANRKAGKMDAKWAALSEEQRWIEGDLRPDFVYTL